MKALAQRAGMKTAAWFTLVEQMRILLIGSRGGTHVGASFERAAGKLGYTITVLDPLQAYAGPRWLRSYNWWMHGRLPSRLAQFDADLLALADQNKVEVVLSVGISPPGREASKELRQRGIRLINYLTDDPWHSRLKATWFINALPEYDVVYTTKRALFGDLKKAGAPEVRFLPFAYDPELQYPAEHGSDQLNGPQSIDIYFAGGGDSDRFPFLRALIQAGCKVAIHGGFWDRDPVIRNAWIGHANPEQLRNTTTVANVCLCLVRRANRDGHVMRTFEIAAMGRCILAEDTGEHREILGPEGECATYCLNESEMVEKAKWLLSHPDERNRLAKALHHRITTGKNTYLDRLQAMVGE